MSDVVRAGAPACGIYIRLPVGSAPESLTLKLRQIFFITTNSEYEKNMHVLEVPAEDTQAVQTLITLAQTNGFVAIMRGNPALAARFGADGVLLEHSDDVIRAREALGDERIIGMRCGVFQDWAEKALECGCDYISFFFPGEGGLPPEQLPAWWSTITTKPCLIEGPMTNDDCGDFVKAGAAFIDSSSFIWGHSEGPMQATVDMLYAIDLALAEMKRN